MPTVNKSTKVRFVEAGPGADITPQVREEMLYAEQDHRRLLVYLGAPWCEPCQRLHRAIMNGELDSYLPPLTILEFDDDRDANRLAAAGYRSRYIPLLAVPGADGRSSGKQMEGGTKGPGAVAQLTPRIQQLLGSSAPATSP